MRRAMVAGLLALWASQACGADAPLKEQQAEARRQQADLRERIDALRSKIDGQESARRDAATALKESETAISDINRRLVELDGRHKELKARLADLAHQTDQQKGTLAQRQAELGDQLRAQYAGGLSPWTALLSGDDPQAIGRELGYLGYITQAQARAVRAVREALDELASLRQRTHESEQELAGVIKETATRKADLETQKAERETVLARVDDALKEQRRQAERLTRNDQRLGELIEGLDAEIARQAEIARKEAERRRAEAARKAEEARRAALERQRALERERERARQAELAARQAREEAERVRQQLEASKAREQVENAREAAREAERLERAREAAREAEREAELARRQARQQAEEDRQVQAQREARQQPGATLRGTAEGLAPGQPSQAAPAKAAAPSPAALKGLSKHLPYPVRGDVQGRFGAQRPDGGVWRGIVLRAPEGTPVHAVAAGRVVYANWLSGFGNIMIVDHGAKNLTVYAYNQSLLKRVGDMVSAGDTIASVGATGGQVEPGLYFEIRQQGTPVNPLLWLGR